MDVIQGHGLRRILNQVGDIVHGIDQGVDLLPVNRCNKRHMNGFVDVVRNPVSGTLGVVHILVVFLAQMLITVVGHQLRERHGRLDDAVCMLIEHLEKIAFARQQLAKKHGGLLKGTCHIFDYFVTARSLTA